MLGSLPSVCPCGLSSVLLTGRPVSSVPTYRSTPHLGPHLTITVSPRPISKNSHHQVCSFNIWMGGGGKGCKHSVHNKPWIHTLNLTLRERKQIKEHSTGTPLASQWPSLGAPSTGSSGSAPGQGARSRVSQRKWNTPHATTKTRHSQINNDLFQKWP